MFSARLEAEGSVEGGDPKYVNERATRGIGHDLQGLAWKVTVLGLDVLKY
jgi:hypothetical protein